MAASAEYRLREFVAEDFDAAIALWTAMEGVGLTAADTRREITAFLARSPGFSAVVIDGAGTVIGAVLCGHDGRRGNLYHLAVHPAHRGHGLGEKLVEHCMTRLRALGLEKCNIHVFARNGAGLAFWSKRRWKTREDLVLMQYVL